MSGELDVLEMVLSHSVGRLLEPKFIEELKVLAGALT